MVFLARRGKAERGTWRLQGDISACATPAAGGLLLLRLLGRFFLGRRTQLEKPKRQLVQLIRYHARTLLQRGRSDVHLEISNSAAAAPATVDVRAAPVPCLGCMEQIRPLACREAHRTQVTTSLFFGARVTAVGGLDYCGAVLRCCTGESE